MARYDTFGSGYQDRLPGMSPTDVHGYGTAQGSAGAGADGAGEQFDLAANLASQSDTNPLIVPVQDSVAMGVHVPVHEADTLVGGQEGLYNGDAPDLTFGGVGTKQFGTGGTFQPGGDRYGHFAHPNADSGRPVGRP
jgi:hypothetical protein